MTKRCFVLSHKGDDNDYCVRCGEDLLFPITRRTLPELVSHARWLATTWLRRKFLKCEWCGKRNCGNPEDATHLMF